MQCFIILCYSKKHIFIRLLIWYFSSNILQEEIATLEVKMVCRAWDDVCDRVHAATDSFFARWASLVWRWPKLVILCGVLTTLTFSAGFASFNVYGQAERIYYDQDSQIFHDLNKVRPAFDYYVQQEELLVSTVNKNESVLNETYLQFVRDLQEGVLGIRGLDRFCVKTGNNCVTNDIAAQLCQPNDTSQDIQRNLMNLLNNETRLMPNGLPAKDNIPMLLGNFRVTDAQEVFANAIRFQIYVHFAGTRDQYERNKHWEGQMLAYLASKRPEAEKKHGLKLDYVTVRSLDDSVSENIMQNFLLACVSVAMIVAFCAISNIRCGNLVKSHFLVSLVGVACIVLGIGAGFGITLLIGRPFVGFIGILPFLLIGVGIDDMFIILNKADAIGGNVASENTLVEIMRSVGFSITMTTLTDVIAFIVGSVSRFPAVQIFCTYAFFSLVFIYLTLMSVFLACLTYDLRRVAQNRQDCVPCSISSDVQMGKSSYYNKIMQFYGEIIMLLPSKIVIVICSLTAAGFGVYGALYTSLDFDYKILGPETSDFVRWINVIKRTFPDQDQFPIDVILQGSHNFSTTKLERQFELLNGIAIKNTYFSKNTVNWMTSFKKWRRHPRDFKTVSTRFLSENPRFRRDIVMNSSTFEITASRVHLFTVPSNKWLFRTKAMKSLRQDLIDHNLNFTAVTFYYIYASQMEIIVEESYTNLIICCAAILVVTLPYLVHFRVILLLLLSFAAYIAELLGIMYLLELPLNSVTMIIMIMAIGFTIDYSCHITHAYLKSPETLPGQRVVDAIATMGASVFKGGLSTLMGVVVLVFSPSKLFVVFFKMMTTIIVLGLTHGLLFVPVYLSIFCRSPRICKNKNKTSESEVLQLVSSI